MNRFKRIEESRARDREYRQGWWQFAVQSVLALTTIIAVLLAFDSSRDALDESRRAQDEELRPFLKIGYAEVMPVFQLTGLKSKGDRPDTLDREVKIDDSTDLESTEFLIDSADIGRLEHLIFEFQRRLEYKNLGKRPLRVTGIAAGTLNSIEWDSLFHKDENIMINHLRTNDLISKQDVDLTVLPGESIKGSSLLGSLSTSISGDDIRKCIPESGAVVVYFWEYIEYEDFSSNTYNLFSMYNGRISMNAVSSGIAMKPFFIPGTERLRYDVGE